MSGAQEVAVFGEERDLNVVDIEFDSVACHKRRKLTVFLRLCQISGSQLVACLDSRLCYLAIACRVVDASDDRIDELGKFS